MANIKDLVKLYSTGNTTTTEDGRMLAFSLAEIQTELLALREAIGKNSSVPTEVVTTIDTSALERAISELKPLPPQNLDLNPVYRSYEQTAKAIRELLGEVKTTNTRIAHIGGGGYAPPDPRHLIDIKRSITDAESRLDYAARSDSNPVYVGKAENGTPTTTQTWVIQRLTYDGTDRLIRVEVLTGAWDSRASLPWS